MRERQGDLFGRPSQAQKVLDGTKKNRVKVKFAHRAVLHTPVSTGLLREGAAVRTCDAVES